MSRTTTGARLAALSALFFLLGACGSERTVYVTADALNLRSGPSTQTKVIGRLLRGEELSVTRREGAWLVVTTDEGREGWVHGDYVGDPAAVRAAFKQDTRTTSPTRHVRRSGDRAAGTEPGPATPSDPTKLNLSVDEMLEGFPEDTTIESLAPINGEDRSRAVLAGRRVAEFWGDDGNLSRAAMVIPVVGEPDEAVARDAMLALTFVRNAVPRWDRDAAWLADRLRVLTSQDVGRMGFDADGKSVRFDYIKPLGSVRVMIYPEA